MDSTWTSGLGLTVVGSISRVHKAILSARFSYDACRLRVS